MRHNKRMRENRDRFIFGVQQHSGKSVSELMPLLCHQKKSVKIRVIRVICVRFKRDDPNQPLQATAGSLFFEMFCGFRRVLVGRTAFGKPPPRLNSGR